MIDFKVFGGFGDRLTNERTFVLLESLLRLKIILVTKVTIEVLLSICPTIRHQNLRTSHSNSKLFTN